ncbi:MAG: double zinc ribbon domain-containing protein [Methanobacterium sp.]
MEKMKCPSCGAEVEESNKFCTECGGKMEQEIKCHQCSTKVPQGTKFCTECGAKIETVSKPEEIKCPKCSKILPADSKFCPQCGTKIGEHKSKNEVDETIETLKDTGKDLMKEAGGLFKKFR